MAEERRPEPPPMRTNDVLVAAAGTAVWGVALIVLLLIGLPDDDHWWLWVCVTGMGIGLFGMWQIPRIQRSRDSLLARNAARKTPTEG
jgi:hypothetical protein